MGALGFREQAVSCPVHAIVESAVITRGVQSWVAAYRLYGRIVYN